MSNAAQVRFDQRQRRAYGCAVRRFDLQIRRTNRSHRRRTWSAARSRDHFHCVFKNFRLVRFDGVATERVHRRSVSNRLAVNGEHRFVTSVARNLLYVLVISAKRHGEAIYFDPEPLLEQGFATDNFVLDPLLVLRASQFLFRPFSAGLHHHDSVTFA